MQANCEVAMLIRAHFWFRFRSGRAVRTIATLACAFAMVAFARHGALAEVATGGVYVTTLPSGAEIWVDGTYVGRSPVLVDALTPGRHALTITKSGWNVREVGVDVPAGSTALSSTALVAAAGSGIGGAGASGGNITLRGVPNGAKISIDGSALDDPNRTIALPAGQHKLTIDDKHGGGRTTRGFVVFPETLSVLVLREPARIGRSHVVGLADDYVPGSYTLANGKIVLRYEGHLVIARIGDISIRYDGTDVAYDSPPETIGGKLYLPLELLVRLTGGSGDSHAIVTPRPRVAPAPPSGPTLTPTAGPNSPASPSPATGATPSP